MGENIRWAVTRHDMDEFYEDEPFAVLPTSGGGFVVLTKRPFFDESTHDPKDTPRETQVLPARKPKKGGKGDRKRRVVQG